MMNVIIVNLIGDGELIDTYVIEDTPKNRDLASDLIDVFEETCSNEYLMSEYGCDLDDPRELIDIITSQFEGQEFNYKLFEGNI